MATHAMAQRLAIRAQRPMYVPLVRRFYARLRNPVRSLSASLKPVHASAQIASMGPPVMTHLSVPSAIYVRTEPVRGMTSVEAARPMRIASAARASVAHVRTMETPVETYHRKVSALRVTFYRAATGFSKYKAVVPPAVVAMAAWLNAHLASKAARSLEHMHGYVSKTMGASDKATPYAR